MSSSAFAEIVDSGAARTLLLGREAFSTGFRFCQAHQPARLGKYARGPFGINPVEQKSQMHANGIIISLSHGPVGLGQAGIAQPTRGGKMVKVGICQLQFRLPGRIQQEPALDIACRPPSKKVQKASQCLYWPARQPLHST